LCGAHVFLVTVRWALPKAVAGSKLHNPTQRNQYGGISHRMEKTCPCSPSPTGHSMPTHCSSPTHQIDALCWGSKKENMFPSAYMVQLFVQAILKVSPRKLFQFYFILVFLIGCQHQEKNVNSPAHSNTSLFRPLKSTETNVITVNNLLFVGRNGLDVQCYKF
jgi:hypothetical protein